MKPNPILSGAMLAVTGACALAFPSCALAGRATNQMPVSVNPISGCTVSAEPLYFYLLVPANINVDSTTSISVNCPPNTAYTVDIDDGLYPNGSNRRVFNSGANDYATYQVYKDPPRSQVWGRGNLKNVSGNSGTTGASLLTVYGRLSASKSMKAGSYNDTLTITVTF